MKITIALEKMKKSQLQTYFQFWCTDTDVEKGRDKLIAKLQFNMKNSVVINQKFDSLKNSEKRFLLGTLMLKKSSGCVKDILKQPPARSIEDYELESILKRLKEKGFLLKAEQQNGKRRRSDLFTVPEEIAEVLQDSLDLEKRSAGQFISLEEVIKKKKEKDIDVNELLNLSSVKKSINSLEDPVLQTVFWETIGNFGGIFLLSDWRRLEGNGQLNNPSWRKQLEERNLGTTGFLNLKPFGIEVEENTLCAYQEIVKLFGIEKARRKIPENDREISVGADLIFDLSRLLQIVYIEPLELTREGSLYKRKEEKLKQNFVLSSYDSLLEGKIFKRLVFLGEKLGLMEINNNKLCVKKIKSSNWEKKTVLERAKKILGFFIEEQGRDHYSFHQKFLRLIFIEMLSHEKTGEWLLSSAFIQSVVSTFLLSLGRFRINKYFREKVNSNSGNEALIVSLERLRFDLCYWLLHRLALSGIVDLGYRKGHLNSIALSSLGADVLGVNNQRDETGGDLLVNPDFEILHFPGGKSYPEDALFLSSFAERSGSGRVKRYHLTRQGISRFILSGMSIEDVVNFLNNRARENVPGNVIYTLREWSEGVELIHRQSAVVLRSQTKEGMDRIIEVLSEEKISFERVLPIMILLKKTKSEKKLLQCKNKLREEGLYID